MATGPEESQAQRGRVLFGFESEVRDARVLAGGLGRRCCGHHRSGRGRLRRQGGQGQAEGRGREHHVGRVRRQVRVEVVVRVRHGAVQLQLCLHLKGQGRHVAMTILKGVTRMERDKSVNGPPSHRGAPHSPALQRAHPLLGVGVGGVS